MQSDEVGLKLLGQPWVRFPGLFKLLRAVGAGCAAAFRVEWASGQPEELLKEITSGLRCEAA